MDLIHQRVWGMENGNQTLERLSVQVDREQQLLVLQHWVCHSNHVLDVMIILVLYKHVCFYSSDV